MIRSYPEAWTAARLCCGVICDSSNPTDSRLDAKFTDASVTPGSFRTVCSTLMAQDAQLISSTG